MIEQVTPRSGLSATLSTGTTISVWPATDSDGRNAWCAKLEGTNGDVMEFGLGHEAFQTFVNLVVELYAKEGGFSVKN